MSEVKEGGAPPPGSRVKEDKRGPSPWRIKVPAVTGDQVMEGHDYDGIQEQDNSLPNWWLGILYLTTLFALGYWFYYHSYGMGTLPGEAYRQETAAAEARAAARARAAASSPEALAALARDANLVNQGRGVFQTTCVPCHGPTGGGTIGPNLTDDHWINGGAPDRIFRTINEGVLARGMPAWGPQLGPDRVRAVLAFVLSIKNTNVAGGKPPQGNREP